MGKEQTNVGSPIAEFIEQAKNQVIKGLGDWELTDSIDFELSGVVGGEAGGGVDLKILHIGAKVRSEEVQKIKLSIRPKDEVTEAKRKAEIATAKAQETMAKKAPFHRDVQTRK